MAANMIVMVLDLDDPKRGEMNVVDDARGAERLVESLLESGFAQERIRVFSASMMEMKIVHRPVVSFVDAGSQTPTQDEASLVESGTKS